MGSSRATGAGKHQEGMQYGTTADCVPSSRLVRACHEQLSIPDARPARG